MAELVNLIPGKNKCLISAVAVTGGGDTSKEISDFIFMHYKVQVQIILATSMHLNHNVH